jgi:NAD-dependent DNA ligase
MNIVFTGPATVDGVRVTRGYLVEIARERGHRVQKMVEWNTDLVVQSKASFKNRKGKKLLMADVLDIKCVDADEFIKMITEGKC